MIKIGVKKQTNLLIMIGVKKQTDNDRSKDNLLSTCFKNWDEKKKMDEVFMYS